MFDATINLGTLIQTFAFVTGGLYFIWSLKTKLEVMDAKQVTVVEKMDKLEIEISKLTEVTIEQAKQTARIDNVEHRLQELSDRIFNHVNNVLSKNSKIKTRIRN